MTNLAKRVTASKYMGDDAYSWAVFIDGKTFVTGLCKREVPHYKNRALETLKEKSND